MFGSSLPPVVCFIYVILLCVFTFRVLCCDVSVRLYLQLFALFMLSYYVSLCSVFCVVMFGSSLPPVVCFIYVILLCVFTFRVLCCDVSVRLYLQLFALFMLSYYVSLCSVFCVVIFGSSLPQVVCLIYVILLSVFTFLVLCCDVWFVFTSSCLSYLRYNIMCLYLLSSVL